MSYTGNTYTLLHNLGNVNKQHKQYTCNCESCENRKKPIIYRRPIKRLPLAPLSIDTSRPHTAMKQMIAKRKLSGKQLIIEKFKQLNSYFRYESYTEDLENDKDNEEF